jgi:hypothetical protein
LTSSFTLWVLSKGEEGQMLLGTRVRRVFCLASILTMMSSYPASLAAACPGGGGGEIEEGRMTVTPTQIDFTRTSEINVTFRYIGPRPIRTFDNERVAGAILGGREPEDYTESIDRCEDGRGRGIWLNSGEECTVFGVGHLSMRRSSATLQLRPKETALPSAYASLINS